MTIQLGIEVKLKKNDDGLLPEQYYIIGDEAFSRHWESQR
jgi:hypothetical protein